VVALGRGGADIAAKDALACVFGYGVGIDFTRRDMQDEAKRTKRPWDMSKARARLPRCRCAALTRAAALRGSTSRDLCLRWCRLRACGTRWRAPSGAEHLPRFRAQRGAAA
jgi:hypothetical protein